MIDLGNHTGSACDPDWLRDRYGFDSIARCKHLEAVVLSHFHERRFIGILDVGAGLGANTRYYGGLLACDQEWILVEEDPSLARTCLSDLTRWAESNGWDYRPLPEGLEIRGRDKRIMIHLVETSICNVGGLVDLSSVDLATANAVFDLLSEGQLTSFLSELCCFGIPIFATMNYRSMRFQPQQERDAAYIGVYERHMQRPRDVGCAVGRDCSDMMITCLEGMGYEVRSGSSTWIITSADRKMLRSMLAFMGGAISEMVPASTEGAKLDQWISGKLDQADKGRLQLRVEHMDIFGRSPDPA